MVNQVQGSGGGAPQAGFADFETQGAGMPPAAAEGQQCGGPKPAAAGEMPGKVQTVANPTGPGAGEPAKGDDIAAKVVEQVTKMLEPIMKKLEEIMAAVKKLGEGDKGAAPAGASPAGNAQPVSNTQNGGFTKADVDELRGISKDLAAAAGEPPKDAGKADPAAAGDKKGGVQTVANKTGAEPANDANADPAGAKPTDAKPADAKKDPLANLNAAVDRLNKWMDKQEAAGKDGGDIKPVSNPSEGAAKDGLPAEVKKMLGDLSKELSALADKIEKLLPKEGAATQPVASEGMCGKRDAAALDPFRQKEPTALAA